MAISRALRRLLRIRNLEEEQHRMALESALGELSHLQDAMAATAERERKGRSLIQAGARTNQLPDRLAGLEETRAADRLMALLEPRISIKEDEVTAHRQEFLRKRIERRQAEILIEEAEASDDIQADRRSQQSLDDWYSSRQFRDGVDAEPPISAEEEFPTSMLTAPKPSAKEPPSCAGKRT
jgi:hypothetical protein